MTLFRLLPARLPPILGAALLLAACSDDTSGNGAAAGDPACAGKVLGYASLIDLGDAWAVPITLNGQRNSMLVDTSSFSTVLATSAAKRLGVELKPEPFDYPVGVGTLATQTVATLTSFDFIGETIERLTMPVGDMPLPSLAAAPVAGVVGDSLLSGNDTEIDFVQHRLTVHADPTCPTFIPPWGGHITRLLADPAYQAIGESGAAPTDAKADRRDIKEQERLARLYATVPRVRLSVNDADITALLDLGGTTVIDPRAAGRAKITVAGPEVKLVTLTGPVRGTRVRVETLLVGDQLFHDVSVIVARVPLEHADMVLGGDVLQGERLWFAFKSKQIFLQFPGSK